MLFFVCVWEGGGHSPSIILNSAPEMGEQTGFSSILGEAKDLSLNPNSATHSGLRHQNSWYKGDII